jgi:hypothetical protein
MHSTITSWFNLRRFDEAGTEGGEEGGEEGKQSKSTGNEGKGDEPKLTQAEVDRIVKDRVARERAKFADYDDVKARAAKFDEIDTANKTELEREKEARAAAETKATQASTTAERVAIRSAVIAAAAEAGALKPSDVVALLPKGAVTVTLTDDGEVEVVGAEEAVAAILKERQHWLKQESTGTRQGGTFDGGAGAGNGNGKTDMRKASKEELDAALAKYGIRSRS